MIALTGRSEMSQVAELGAKQVLPRGALQPGGRCAAAGDIASPLVTLELRTLYLKDPSFFGCTIPQPDVFPNIIAYIERAEIIPPIAKTSPLHAIVDA